MFHVFALVIHFPIILHALYIQMFEFVTAFDMIDLLM